MSAEVPDQNTPPRLPAEIARRIFETDQLGDMVVAADYALRVADSAVEAISTQRDRAHEDLQQNQLLAVTVRQQIQYLLRAQAGLEDTNQQLEARLRFITDLETGENGVRNTVALIEGYRQTGRALYASIVATALEQDATKKEREKIEPTRDGHQAEVDKMKTAEPEKQERLRYLEALVNTLGPDGISDDLRNEYYSLQQEDMPYIGGNRNRHADLAAHLTPKIEGYLAREWELQQEINGLTRQLIDTTMHIADAGYRLEDIDNALRGMRGELRKTKNTQQAALAEARLAVFDTILKRARKDVAGLQAAGHIMTREQIEASLNGDDVLEDATVAAATAVA
jgi:hypothetical protein